MTNMNYFDTCYSIRAFGIFKLKMLLVPIVRTRTLYVGNRV